MDETTLTTPCNLNTKLKDELLAAFQAAFTPNDNRPIYEWAGQHVSLDSGYSITGRFDVSISPHFRKIFQAFQDPYVREVNILAPPRSGKTLIAELGLLHTIANNSGDILWLQLSEEKAEQMSDLRMIPLLKSCKPVADLINFDNKYNITGSRYKFLHSTVHVTSPKPNALNAVGYKIVFGDEVWKYNGQGIIKEIKRRTDDYRGVSKCLFFSQGGLKDSAWHEQYQSGEVYEYGWTCPSCKKLQRFQLQNKREDGTYSGIVWPDNAHTRINGKWNIREAARQAALECHHCKAHVTDTPANRKLLLDTGDYIRVNTDSECESTVKSFRFTNLCNVKISYADLVTRFLQAHAKKDYFGDTTDLEHFITKDMADFWDEYKRNTRTEIRLSNYDTAKPFGEFEAYRFLTVDCQQKEPYYYYVVRAWNKQGESRLISYGTANTWGEIESIRDRNKVDYRFVFVDTGDGTKKEAIYAECLKRGRYAYFGNVQTWVCYNSLKGSGVKGFKIGNKWSRYNEPVEIPAASAEDAGKTLLHHTYSSYRMSEILETLRDGKGKLWEAADVSEEYTQHLNAVIHQRKLTKDSREEWEYVDKPNTPNHFWDCEKMQVVAADICGCIDATMQPDDPKTVVAD